MGAVCLYPSVTRVPVGQQSVTALIGSTYVERAAQGVGRQLIPKTLDAIVGRCRIVEVGVGEIKANVLHAYHHIFPRKGMGQRVFSLINRGGIEPKSH